MIKTIALALTATALMAAPAMAAACSGSFALDPEWNTEKEMNDYNEILLEGKGVDVIRAEMWGGCIRVWVRTAEGGEEMQFYEPVGLRRVQ
jgi:hypothetical protein